MDNQYPRESPKTEAKVTKGFASKYLIGSLSIIFMASLFTLGVFFPTDANFEVNTITSAWKKPTISGQISSFLLPLPLIIFGVLLIYFWRTAPDELAEIFPSPKNRSAKAFSLVKFLGTVSGVFLLFLLVSPNETILMSFRTIFIFLSGTSAFLLSTQIAKIRTGTTKNYSSIYFSLVFFSVLGVLYLIVGGVQILNLVLLAVITFILVAYFGLEKRELDSS